MPRRVRRRPVRASFVRVLAFAAVAAALCAAWAALALQPAGRGATSTVVVQRGMIGAQVAAMLKHHGLIRNAQVFLWYGQWRGDMHRIRAGRYRLSDGMSASEVLDRLIAGSDDAGGVTIPEGFGIRAIAERLEEARIVVSAQEFERVATRPGSAVRAPFAVPASGLEGYLYPDTYRFSPKTAPAKVAQAMVDRFVDAFWKPRQAAVSQSGHALHEIVTIASLIEREAEVDDDRARIAGVIENRLRRNMRLQIDATVLYALGRHKTRVLYKDLETESPYNTYRNKGLPPGPIASPGMASLLAALSPERHDYLFYVAAPDGSHVFTRTEAEHNVQVARMRALRNAGQRGAR